MAEEQPRQQHTRHPMLEYLGALVGQWETEATHRLSPGTVIRGRATFEWLDGERFLIWRSHYDHPEIPDALALTGVTDDRLSMHYFDSRGVHRIYEMTFEDGTWRMWRDDPDPFPQRFTATFADDGRTISGRWEKAQDGQWSVDFEVTYRKVT